MVSINSAQTTPNGADESKTLAEILGNGLVADIRDYATGVGIGNATADTDALIAAAAAVSVGGSYAGGLVRLPAKTDLLYEEDDYLKFFGTGGFVGESKQTSRIVRNDGINKFLKIGDESRALFETLGGRFLDFAIHDSVGTDTTNESVTLEKAFQIDLDIFWSLTQRALSVGKLASCSNIRLGRSKLRQRKGAVDAIAIYQVGDIDFSETFAYTTATSDTDAGLTGGALIAAIPGVGQHVDTIRLGDLHALLFYQGLKLAPSGSGSYVVNVFGNSPILDSMKSHGILIDDDGAAASNGHVGNVNIVGGWCTSAQGNGIKMSLDNQYSYGFTFGAHRVYWSGLDAIDIGGTGTAKRGIQFTGGDVVSSNFIAPGTGNVAKVGQNGVQFTGFKFGGKTGADTFHDSKSEYAIEVVSGFDRPTVSEDCEYETTVGYYRDGETKKPQRLSVTKTWSGGATVIKFMTVKAKASTYTAGMIDLSLSGIVAGTGVYCARERYAILNNVDPVSVTEQEGAGYVVPNSGNKPVISVVAVGDDLEIRVTITAANGTKLRIDAEMFGDDYYLIP